MSFVEALKQGSSIFREAREEGRVEGKVEGEAAGRTKEARRLLRGLLRVRFPGLETLSAIDSIDDIDALETLFFDKIATATDRALVEQAILGAARNRP